MPYKDPEKQRAAQLEYYHRNKTRFRETGDRTRTRHRERIRAIKESRPCTDCGLFFPWICMDFDHLGDKVSGISIMVSSRVSWAKIEAEIAKCELVCANCHRIRTHRRQEEHYETDVTFIEAGRLD